MELYVHSAINARNGEILMVLLQKWPHTKPMNIEPYLFRFIFDIVIDESKKIEIVKMLLPNIESSGPHYQYYPFYDIFRIVLYSCVKKNFILTEFFINNLYSANHNTLHPLIKKLEGTVDEWQNIGFLLHSDTNYAQDPVHIETISLFKRHCFENVPGTFLKLLQVNRDLAIEIFCVLYDKGLPEFLISDFRSSNSSMIKRALKDPSSTKMLFQLMYNLINDKTQKQIYGIIDKWTSLYKHHTAQTIPMQVFTPFFIKPLREKILNCPEHRNISLRELTRDIIRSEVFQSVNRDVKEFMDAIWSFCLPTAVKCFLLHISDASWMDN